MYMELTDDLIDRFFRCASTVMIETDGLLTIELWKLVSIDQYDDLIELHDLYSKSELRYAVKSQIEAYLMGKTFLIEDFVLKVEKKYPNTKQTTLKEKDVWEQQLENTKKELGI